MGEKDLDHNFERPVLRGMFIPPEFLQVEPVDPSARREPEYYSGMTGDERRAALGQDPELLNRLKAAKSFYEDLGVG